jgi:hypothetical protein
MVAARQVVAYRDKADGFRDKVCNHMVWGEGLPFYFQKTLEQANFWKGRSLTLQVPINVASPDPAFVMAENAALSPWSTWMFLPEATNVGAVRNLWEESIKSSFTSRLRVSASVKAAFLIQITIQPYKFLLGEEET